MAVFFGEQASTDTPQKENKIMAKDDDMHLRVSKRKKEKIKQRAESLDRTVSEHMLICFDMEESIARGGSVVIPKSNQVSSDGESAHG